MNYEGYTKIYKIKDLENLDTSQHYASIGTFFEALDDYEWSQDIIFFYIWGHGPAITTDNPFVKIKRTGSSERYFYSDVKSGYNDLTTCLGTLESHKIGFLIESCKSGGFVTTMEDKSYCAISSSDTSHNSYAWGGEGRFSHYFWEALKGPIPHNAYNAWHYGKTMNSLDLWWLFVHGLQYPLYDNNLYDQTGYMFFD